MVTSLLSIRRHDQNKNKMRGLVYATVKSSLDISVCSDRSFVELIRAWNGNYTKDRNTQTDQNAVKDTGNINGTDGYSSRP